MFLIVVYPKKSDVKDSARIDMDRASAVILRNAAANGVKLPARKPQFLQQEGEELPAELRNQVRDMLRDTKGIAI